MVDPLVSAVLTVGMVVLLRIVEPVPLGAAHLGLRKRDRSTAAVAGSIQVGIRRAPLGTSIERHQSIQL